VPHSITSRAIDQAGNMQPAIDDPSISVRQRTGNRNEWPLSRRLSLPGNGEDGRNAE
jgi:hypothetical protein